LNVFEAFKKYKCKVEKQIGHHKKLRTDNRK